MGRAPCCDKTNVKKGPWSPEEDAELKAYIEEYGTGGNWITLPQKIGLKRCGKSCRLRWLNYLRPNIKHGGFSEEEDKVICSLYISIGSRWSIIAAQLPGRTDNDIKNYWNTKLKKKLLGRRKQSNTCRFSSMDNRDASSSEDSPGRPPALSNSALERLQLHLQLQRLNSPLPFYSNPALWPRMHPLHHEKMIDSLQLSNENLRNYPDHLLRIDTANYINPRTENDPNVSPSYEPAITADDSITSLQHEPIRIDDSVNNSPAGPQEFSLNMGQMLYGNSNLEEPAAISGLSHSDHRIDNILGQYYSGSGGKNFMSQEDPHQQMMLDFDCFKGIFDDSNSWDDSSSVDVHAGAGITFEDYETAYNKL